MREGVGEGRERETLGPPGLKDEKKHNYIRLRKPHGLYESRHER